ncbi:mucin-17 isoform X2 [Hippocampus zosterae]|nr:mucin-17 isoform X2 [Hippocampus zosterae]
MLSSGMVTVLAPTWSGRLRRSKRFEATGSLETLASLPDAANPKASRPQDDSQWSQSGATRAFNVTQTQPRIPFLSTRQNTTGWSTKSVLQNLDYELQSNVARTISLDGSSKEREIKKAQASTSWDLYGQKRTPQDGHLVRRSSLSSKPTTSGLLLSLRRINSQSMNSNNPTPSEVKPLSLKTGQDAQPFSTHVPQSLHNTLEREKFKPLPSSLSASSRASETEAFSSSSLNNHRGTSKASLFSSLTVNKVSTDTPEQPQPMTREQPSLSWSGQTFVSRRASDNDRNWIGSGRGSNLFFDRDASPHQRIQRDSGVLSESGAPSRNTPGSSTSRWQENSQKGSPISILSDTPNIISKPHTPLIPLPNNNCDTAAPSLTNNKSLQLQCQSSNCSNDSTNAVMKPQKGGPARVKEKYSDDSFDKVRLAKQLHESSSKKVELRKSQHLPDRHSTLSQPRDSMRHDASNGSFQAHVTAFAPSLFNPNRSAPPKIDDRTNNAHQSKPMNPCLFLESTDTLKIQVVPLKNVSGFSQKENAGPPLHSKPDSFPTGSTSQTSKVPNTAPITATPLGFRRSYAATTKPLQPKDVSHHVPMVNDSSETNRSPASVTPSPAATMTPTQMTCTSIPAVTSHPQTPPATAISPNRKVGGILTNQSEKDHKKSAQGYGKRVKHVMWEDSENSEPTKSPDPSVLTSPLSRSMSQRLSRAPSIFSFLRLSSPNPKTTPLCSASRKTSSLQVGEGEKYRSLSSDSADQTLREGGESQQNPTDAMSFVQERRDAIPSPLRRSRSLQADEFLYYSTAPSPDFANGYKIRYSPPPYSSLISSRSETKKATPRTSLFQNVNSTSNYTSNHPLLSHPVADAISSNSKTSLVNSPKPLLSSPLQTKMLSQIQVVPLKNVSGFPQKENAGPPLHSKPDSFPTGSTCQTSKVPNTPPISTPIFAGEHVLHGVSQTGEINNNSYKRICRNQKNGGILLIESRVDEIPQTLQSSKMDKTASPPENRKPESLPFFTKMLSSVAAKPSEETHRTPSHSNQSSSGSSSTESRSVGDEVSSKKMKESVMGKFKLFSVESNNEQSPKRRRFVMKKSVSTPNSESEKANKTSNKMDQVLNKLRQTFGTKRPDDELLPWKWRQASETASVGGLSDTGNTNDATVEGNRTAGREEQAAEPKGRGRAKQGEELAQTSSSLIPALSMTGNESFIWPDQPKPKDQDKESFCPTTPSDQNDAKTRATNPFLLSADPGCSRSPKLSDGHCTKLRKSTSNSKSPFSPFSSLSPHSPFSSTDVADDSVFYSPKMQRRRETSPPCEPGEGIGLVSSRRSRASAGLPSTGPVQGEASCYADLKYGIEPGRSVSVSSVLSSRPSGPGRISTGPRFMSVDDLSESVPIHGRGDEDFKEWLEKNCDHRSIGRMRSYFHGEADQMRSRSLPRSLTRRLAQRGSSVSVCPPADTTASMSPHRWSPNMNTCHFDWDTVSPPTPPPTPPLSPQTRRMSKPSSLSSPNFPSSDAEPLESQSPRGHLPSRGYVSSLSTFEESSDSSSDTTTDDEYYLEKSDDEEKETEL